MPLCCRCFKFPMQQSKNVPQKHIINITYFTGKQHDKTTEAAYTSNSVLSQQKMLTVNNMKMNWENGH